MSDLLKQLETIGQDAAKRNESLDINATKSLQALEKKQMKGILATPDAISKDN